jgi:predicted nucleic acid-binding protein
LPRVRTFVDSGVLIAAFQALGEVSQRALAVLADPDRDFVSSDFVRLEVLPKPVCYGRVRECQFYEAFFRSVKRTVSASRTLVAEAEAQAKLWGLSAIDALHVAAAARGRCTEFITIEVPTKPLFRVTGLKIVSLR